MLLGLPAGERARHLHARVGLLRHQRRRHRVLRRGAAVAGRRASRCACSSRARTRWRGRTTASRSSSISASALDAERRHRRLGLRGVVADARRPARATTTPGNVDHRARWPASSPRRSRRGRRRPSPTATSTTAATPRRRTSPAASADAAAAPGTVESERVLSHTSRRRSSPGPLRSPARLQNTFAHESFMDEVAAHVKADPVAYRAAPSERPAPDRRRAGGGEGGATGRRGRRRGRIPRGPASPPAAASSCVLYEGDNGYCAMVAEVEVESGHRRACTVKRLVVAQDCGPISNPDGMRNQLEGGALQGMSRALGEEVTWDDQKVTSVDWRTLPQPAARLRGAGDRERADQPARRRGHRRRRDGDHRRRRRDRQRDLRRHRRARSARCRSRRSA